jgi:hypothetical protein
VLQIRQGILIVSAVHQQSGNVFGHLRIAQVKLKALLQADNGLVHLPKLEVGLPTQG